MATNPKTILDLANEVAIDILNRTDAINIAVKQVANAYIELCSYVPFPELRRFSSEISVTASDEAQSIASVDPPVAGIISIRYTDNSVSSSRRRLRRRNRRLYDNQSTTPEGPPYSYARIDDETLHFNPIPDDASDTFRLYYWAYPDLDLNDTDGVRTHVLETPREWNELLVFLALERTYIRYQKFEEAQYLSMTTPMPRQRAPAHWRQWEVGIIPRLLNDLLQTIDDREHTDEDHSINPMYRRYTHVRNR